jgi:hypothetical protein
MTNFEGRMTEQTFVELDFFVRGGGPTPNGLYTLWCIRNNKPVIAPINGELEKRVLTAHGFLVNGKLTEKSYGLDVFDKTVEEKKEDMVFDDFVKEYLKIWDDSAPGKLPSGKYSKSNKEDIKKKLKVYMNRYKHSQDTILQATKRYLDKQNVEGYQYCRTAAYFIMKDGESDLATEVEHLNEKEIGDTSSESYGIKIT